MEQTREFITNHQSSGLGRFFIGREMWLTQFQMTISDDAPYRSASGISYPGNFPKSEIPGLLPVQLVAQPTITQYQSATQTGIEFIGGQWRQVWSVTNWTQEQIDAHKKSLVPRSVTMRQAQRALLQAGLLASINAAIASMPGSAGDDARIDWAASSDVERDRDLVKNLGAALGLTESQLDDLFIFAGSIT